MRRLGMILNIEETKANKMSKIKGPLISLSLVIENLFVKDSSPFSEIYFLSRLNKIWKELAGEEIAKSASPAQYRNQELILTLPDATHIQEMHFAKELLRKKINKQFPKRKVQKIILKIKKTD